MHGRAEPAVSQGDPDGNAKGGFVLLDQDFKVRSY